ncbi:MAG TPA: hypothetical protein VF857_06110 [Spirochaetota bacterium]
MKGFNVIRKKYFSTVVVETNNQEGEVALFNYSGTTNGYTRRDTNWPSTNNQIPDYVNMKVTDVGFSILGFNNQPIKAATLIALLRSIVTIKNGEREVKSGPLSEFFKIPGMCSDTLISDYKTGPSFVAIQAEDFPANSTIDFKLDLPGSIGEKVRIVAFLDTIASIAQS